MTSTEAPTGEGGGGENPLVATSESSSGFWSNMGSGGKSAVDNATVQTAGGGIFNDVASTVKDFSDGDWGNAAMDVATDGLDALGAAMDPLGTLASAGVGWLIEHISFLKKGLDELAGNPEAVTAKAQTWQNISKQLTETAETYEQSAAKAGQSYKGEGGPVAYQKTAKGYADSLRGAAGHANSASTAMTIAAAIVGTERGLIRDMISEFIGQLILKGIAALATSWCSFGGTVAAFIADSVVEAGVLAERISSRIAKIVEKLEALAKNANKSKGVIEAAAKALDKVGKVGTDIIRANPIEKSTLNLDKWAEDGHFHVPKPNAADGVAVATEDRRQNNEQADRSKEAAESYEKEHGEGKAE
ncbi:hypothetical protein [Amycolatopsis alkalitolerans]|uniref:PPE domain-containing protein n=1 Tax=Amycolatopsis alkalitolerans TaxID=2547244 RepID=A0A5C4M7I6_9PSEU|nr:hypothetical protein [Amycolatopsis alkalitolerans]TNC28476.1 hypothetical protein FG385_04130 [Amycolatopsis alkalitolerans]